MTLVILVSNAQPNGKQDAAFMMVVRTRIEAKEQPENSHSSRLRGHVIEDWVGVSWEDVSFSLT